MSIKTTTVIYYKEKQLSTIESSKMKMHKKKKNEKKELGVSPKNFNYFHVLSIITFRLFWICKCLTGQPESFRFMVLGSCPICVFNILMKALVL